jgi:DNA (cytosine-5)-methyltransferase 1
LITIGSLFTGIGGLDLGLERAGMQVKWQVEIEKYAVKVLEKHWPKVKRYGDIKGIDWSQVEKVDLVCGGFPCPPVSCAGRRKGNEDVRWLWPEFLRCICEVQPRWVLIENVRGLLSANDGREFTEVLRGLSGAGYDAEWSLLSAKDVGAPHLRERVFIVAYAGRLRVGGLQPERQSGNGEAAGPCGIGEGLALPESLNDNGSERSRRGRPGPSNDSDTMENANGGRCRSSGDGGDIRGPGTPIANGEQLGNPDLEGSQGRLQPLPQLSDEIPPWPPSPSERDKWATILERHPGLAPALAPEPKIRRVVNGLSRRVDRLRCLGNAVVPAVAFVVGKAIVEADEALNR